MSPALPSLWCLSNKWRVNRINTKADACTQSIIPKRETRGMPVPRDPYPPVLTRSGSFLIRLFTLPFAFFLLLSYASSAGESVHQISKSNDVEELSSVPPITALFIAHQPITISPLPSAKCRANRAPWWP